MISLNCEYVEWLTKQRESGWSICRGCEKDTEAEWFHRNNIDCARCLSDSYHAEKEDHKSIIASLEVE